jgi:hypothetical protein
LTASRQGDRHRGDAVVGGQRSLFSEPRAAPDNTDMSTGRSTSRRAASRGREQATARAVAPARSAPEPLAQVAQERRRQARVEAQLTARLAGLQILLGRVLEPGAAAPAGPARGWQP